MNIYHHISLYRRCTCLIMYPLCIPISNLRLPNGLKCHLKCFVVGMGKQVQEYNNSEASKGWTDHLIKNVTSVW